MNNWFLVFLELSIISKRLVSFKFELTIRVNKLDKRQTKRSGCTTRICFSLFPAMPDKRRSGERYFREETAEKKIGISNVISMICNIMSYVKYYVIHIFISSFSLIPTDAFVEWNKIDANKNNFFFPNRVRKRNEPCYTKALYAMNSKQH